MAEASAEMDGNSGNVSGGADRYLIRSKENPLGWQHECFM
jgi:hypothetical protein